MREWDVYVWFIRKVDVHLVCEHERTGNEPVDPESTGLHNSLDEDVRVYVAVKKKDVERTVRRDRTVLGPIEFTHLRRIAQRQTFQIAEMLKAIFFLILKNRLRKMLKKSKCSSL